MLFMDTFLFQLYRYYFGVFFFPFPLALQRKLSHFMFAIGQDMWILQLYSLTSVMWLRTLEGELIVIPRIWHEFFFFKKIYFVLGYNQLPMLW